ncbi:MAG: TatD family hydrolase [Armatimonadetes bacterium]|nr:TatD family hydrolase [Armatimonadota bacterium]
MRLIDTHCHLNDSEAFPDPGAAIDRARSAGVEKLIVIGIDMPSSERAVDIAHQFDDVYATVGWHPSYAANFDPSTLAQIETWLTDPKVVALGEVGLDYHWDHATREQQHECLIAQLDLAERISCGVVFHCRDAYDDLLDLLESRGDGRYLLHCFLGGKRHAERVISLGGYIGVDGPITYKKNDQLRTLIASLPSDRILIETDSPYLTPEPHRGHPNEPAYVAHVNDELAKALGVSPESCADLTTSNAERFFQFP